MKNTKVTERKVTLDEWQDILKKMNFFGRRSGFVSFDLWGKFTFFDSEPSFGGAPVTRTDVLYNISQY
jgi:hypothetical protein